MSAALAVPIVAITSRKTSGLQLIVRAVVSAKEPKNHNCCNQAITPTTGRTGSNNGELPDSTVEAFRKDWTSHHPEGKRRTATANWQDP